jgi:hypothetical protein
MLFGRVDGLATAACLVQGIQVAFRTSENDQSDLAEATAGDGSHRPGPAMPGTTSARNAVAPLLA